MRIYVIGDDGITLCREAPASHLLTVAAIEDAVIASVISRI